MDMSFQCRSTITLRGSASQKGSQKAKGITITIITMAD
jgi:hypothetical protein